MHKEISRPIPWILDIKKELPDFVNKPVYSPLHYGETIEICFVRGIEGETYINGRKFEYKEKNVFFIPPKYIHTSVYTKGGSDKDDMICAFHINLGELSSVLNLKNLMLKDNHLLFDFAFRYNDFEGIWSIVQRITDENRTYISRIIDLLNLFEKILDTKDNHIPIAKYSKRATQLVEFVENNYKERLTIHDVANHFGFSKQYFCKWFKHETGCTFNEFLNSVRIHYACSYLDSGCSVEESAEKCGFSDPSYFTKVFKRFVGKTPKSYSKKSLLW